MSLFESTPQFFAHMHRMAATEWDTNQRAKPPVAVSLPEHDNVQAIAKFMISRSPPGLIPDGTDMPAMVAAAINRVGEHHEMEFPAVVEDAAQPAADRP